MTSSKRAVLRWTGEGDVFSGRSGDGPEMTLDSDAVAGPSPTEALVLALMACMGIDIRMILEKSRVPLEALEVRAETVRAPDPPRRFVRIDMVFRLEGPGADDSPKVQRALDLSKDKYCSVLHTLRSDLDLSFSVEGV
jgi:putative redox protein